jgi:hypothetical protein
VGPGDRVHATRAVTISAIPAVLLVVLLGAMAMDAGAEPDVTPPEADAGMDMAVDDTHAAHFDGTGSTDDTGIASWKWTFEYGGRNVTLLGPEAYFPFEVAGNFTVTLNVTDAAGNWDTDTVEVNVITRPGPVLWLLALDRDGYVDLKWMPPEDDGGSNITSYIVYKGDSEDDLQFGGMGDMAQCTAGDYWVTNGKTYYYAISAVNAVGIGPMSIVANATPMGPPDVPNDFEVSVEGGKVVITWSPPNASEGRANVLKYKVYRGTDTEMLDLLVELEGVFTYTDTSADVGTTYYYAVGAESELGQGELTRLDEVVVGAEDKAGGPLAPMVAVAALVATVALVPSRRRHQR